MASEIHEWQRERDKNHLRMLDGKDGVEHDPKDTYYNPKQFRGGKSTPERSISKTVLASLVVGALLLIGVADYATRGQIYSLIHSKTASKALVADELKKQDSAPAMATTTEATTVKGLMNACTRGDYASAQDIQVFRDYSDDFMKKAEVAPVV